MVFLHFKLYDPNYRQNKGIYLLVCFIYFVVFPIIVSTLPLGFDTSQKFNKLNKGQLRLYQHP